MGEKGSGEEGEIGREEREEEGEREKQTVSGDTKVTNAHCHHYGDDQYGDCIHGFLLK